MTIAMHYNLRQLDVAPVALGFNYEIHNMHQPITSTIMIIFIHQKVEKKHSTSMDHKSIMHPFAKFQLNPRTRG